jgi:TetR/AcrR family transcriptional regulator, cholesterol catabolism regulator
MAVAQRKSGLSRSERMETRRRELATLTMQLVRERGFGALSVNLLAERASMSVGGLYRYIKTKSDLLEMICDEINRGMLAAMRDGASEVKGVLGKLKSGYKVYWETCWDSSEPILTAYREWPSLPESARHRYTQQETEIAQFMSDLIRAGVANDEFRAVDERLLASEMVLLAQMKAVKGWTLVGRERDAVFAEHWELISGRLRK